MSQVSGPKADKIVATVIAELTRKDGAVKGYSIVARLWKHPEFVDAMPVHIGLAVQAAVDRGIIEKHGEIRDFSYSLTQAGQQMLDAKSAMSAGDQDLK